MLDVECGMWNLESGVWNVEGGKWRVEGGMWNVEGGIWNLEGGRRSVLLMILDFWPATGRWNFESSNPFKPETILVSTKPSDLNPCTSDPLGALKP
jgi:hypothetical protein